MTVTRAPQKERRDDDTGAKGKGKKCLNTTRRERGLIRRLQGGERLPRAPPPSSFR
jgi:hypothetical protein